jgi:hypothetical protein
LALLSITDGSEAVEAWCADIKSRTVSPGLEKSSLSRVIKWDEIIVSVIEVTGGSTLANTPLGGSGVHTNTFLSSYLCLSIEYLLNK